MITYTITPPFRRVPTEAFADDEPRRENPFAAIRAEYLRDLAAYAHKHRTRTLSPDNIWGGTADTFPSTDMERGVLAKMIPVTVPDATYWEICRELLQAPLLADAAERTARKARPGTHVTKQVTHVTKRIFRSVHYDCGNVAVLSKLLRKIGFATSQQFDLHATTIGGPRADIAAVDPSTSYMSASNIRAWKNRTPKVDMFIGGSLAAPRADDAVLSIAYVLSTLNPGGHAAILIAGAGIDLSTREADYIHLFAQCFDVTRIIQTTLGSAYLCGNGFRTVIVPKYHMFLASGLVLYRAEYTRDREYTVMIDMLRAALGAIYDTRRAHYTRVLEKIDELSAVHRMYSGDIMDAVANDDAWRELVDYE